MLAARAERERGKSYEAKGHYVSAKTASGRLAAGRRRRGVGRRRRRQKPPALEDAKRLKPQLQNRKGRLGTAVAE